MLNPDPVIMWSFAAVDKPQEITYKIRGVLSEDCKRQIKMTGIADELGLDLAKDRFSILWALALIPVTGLVVVYIGVPFVSTRYLLQCKQRYR